MRLIGILLALVLTLALLRLVMIALCVGLLLILVGVAVVRPRQALAVIFFGVIGTAAEAYPILCLIMLIALAYLLGEGEAIPPS